jgi:hypothetical protein
MSPHNEAMANKKIPKPLWRERLMEASELIYGQSVIVTARWILVVTGLFLVLWNPDPLGSLRVQVVAIIMLALMNFYLQAQILMRRQTITAVVYAASIVDFTIITVLIMLSGGFYSETYVFYFPAMMAISVAFNKEVTIGFVAAAAVAYALIFLASAPDVTSLPVLMIRLLMMAGILVCGNLYWRIEHERRLAGSNAHEKLLAEVKRAQMPQNVEETSDEQTA